MNSFSSLVLIPLLIVTLAAQIAAPVASTEQALASFKAAMIASEPAEVRYGDWSNQFLRWREERNQAFVQPGLTFFAARPTDPRRWDAMQSIMFIRRAYGKAIDPDLATAKEL